MYTTKINENNSQAIVFDDMILTKKMVTSAGSKMLDGYESLFDAEVYTSLSNAGFEIDGKSVTGEFAIDLLGETSYHGAIIKDGIIKNAAAEILKKNEAIATINLDVNGAVRRAAAQNNLICLKPTYGAVSRYGVIPVACSGDTVSIMTRDTKSCSEILNTIVRHDDKDGTSLSEENCKLLKENESKLKNGKVVILNSLMSEVNEEVAQKINNFCDILQKRGVIIEKIDDDIIVKSRIAWNILMCAELCNNVSRYDGVKFGYRAKEFTNIDELYTKSRTEACGELLKTAILYGSETLSTQNYSKVYDKALRIRRVISEAFDKLFVDYDAVIIPACSTMNYTENQVKENKYISFEENVYTAPSSITGLPTMIVGGVQVIGSPLSENKLLEIAKMYEEEGE